jgi:hypothetical protein
MVQQVWSSAIRSFLERFQAPGKLLELAIWLQRGFI